MELLKPLAHNVQVHRIIEYLILQMHVSVSQNIIKIQMVTVKAVPLHGPRFVLILTLL